MVWCRVTRHPQIFHELTGCQRTLGIWGVTDKESIRDKGHAWKNEISEKKKLLNPLCNKQLDDSPRRWKSHRAKNDNIKNQ